MTLYIDAAEFIAKWEGFEAHAYWDVNAWRVGYGSDTRTAAQVKVKSGDVETRADALANLAKRVETFHNTVMNECGEPYDALPRGAQIALLDMAYNYGSLPIDVRNAVAKGGTLRIIGSTVRRHAHDRPLNDHGKPVNYKRRMAEAHLIDGL
jgi:GH24 family phage-related lysozyme (muramidase)